MSEGNQSYEDTDCSAVGRKDKNVQRLPWSAIGPHHTGHSGDSRPSENHRCFPSSPTFTFPLSPQGKDSPKKSHCWIYRIEEDQYYCHQLNRLMGVRLVRPTKHGSLGWVGVGPQRQRTLDTKRDETGYPVRKVISDLLEWLLMKFIGQSNCGIIYSDRNGELFS